MALIRLAPSRRRAIRLGNCISRTSVDLADFRIDFRVLLWLPRLWVAAGHGFNLEANGKTMHWFHLFFSAGGRLRSGFSRISENRVFRLRRYTEVTLDVCEIELDELRVVKTQPSRFAVRVWLPVDDEDLIG
jgi:hypothetical protein